MEREDKLDVGCRFRVVGWIMLKGVNEGIYKVLAKDGFSYTFQKGKSKPLRFYKEDIEISMKPLNNNRIEKL